MSLAETIDKSRVLDEPPSSAWSVDQVFRHHADFVWACLQPYMRPSLNGEAVLIGALVGLIVSVALLTEGRHQLQLECIARGYFWISKVPKRYLQHLPPWPVPRPSFWRRAFFGPAGISPAKPSAVPEQA